MQQRSFLRMIQYGRKIFLGSILLVFMGLSGIPGGSESAFEDVDAGEAVAGVTKTGDAGICKTTAEILATPLPQRPQNFQELRYDVLPV